MFKEGPESGFGFGVGEDGPLKSENKTKHHEEISPEALDVALEIYKAIGESLVDLLKKDPETIGESELADLIASGDEVGTPLIMAGEIEKGGRVKELVSVLSELRSIFFEDKIGNTAYLLERLGELSDEFEKENLGK